jgi:thiol-disulfide isomerase/thioredoxin
MLNGKFSEVFLYRRHVFCYIFLFFLHLVILKLLFCSSSIYLSIMYDFVYVIFIRCPPCKQIAPVFDALARENSQTANDIVFVKVDVDKVPTIKSILGVWAMPSFFFLKDGNKVGSFMGANENLLRKGIANDGYVGSICSSCIIQ